MNDFDMIIHKFYGGHDITIRPVSDVHFGVDECMIERFERFVQYVKDTPNFYVTLGGDLIDNATKSSIGNVYRSMPPSLQKKEMARLLEPIRDRILCGVSGNHERRSSSGKGGVDDDPTYDILCKLDKEDVYRENIAVMKIQLGVEDHNINGDYRPTYSIIVTHGSGGGILTGAAVNRGQRFGYMFSGNMDALILGHTHQPWNTKYKKIRIDTHTNKVTAESFVVLCATSWLEYSGYPVQKMYYPSAFAEQSLILSGKNKEITIQTK